jgi:hypothetical protein
MDADDRLADTIFRALMDCRYAPPKRRRAAWQEGYEEDTVEARRVARAVVQALKRSGYVISRPSPTVPHSIP